jgi:prevent-host-death family protein
MTEMVVGIRELKTQLSEYLRRVKAGQTIVITERGQPIGRIIPQPISLEERMQYLFDACLASWSGKKPDRIEPMVINNSDILASDIVVELRE